VRATSGFEWGCGAVAQAVVVDLTHAMSLMWAEPHLDDTLATAARRQAAANGAKQQQG
jgi:hypothetical protein